MIAYDRKLRVYEDLRPCEHFLGHRKLTPWSCFNCSAILSRQVEDFGAHRRVYRSQGDSIRVLKLALTASQRGPISMTVYSIT